LGWEKKRDGGGFQKGLPHARKKKRTGIIKSPEFPIRSNAEGELVKEERGGGPRTSPQLHP